MISRTHRHALFIENEGGVWNLLKRKLMVAIFILIIFVANCVFIVSGYRFSAKNAAKSNPYITKNYQLFASYKTGPFGIFLFKSNVNRMYRTVLSQRHGIFYRSNVSVSIPYQLGALETVGYFNDSTPDHGFTFMSFKSNSNNVAYLEAGEKTNHEIKEIKKGQTVFFLFDKYLWKPDVKAFDSQGRELYYYGYPNNTSVFTVNSFKWHRFRTIGKGLRLERNEAAYS